MQRKIGKYVTNNLTGADYQVYIPAELPPTPAIELEKLSALLEKASASLAKLNKLAQTIPNTSLFVYMYICKEALLSSQIEGTQSSFSDLMLFEQQQQPNIELDDVEEVSNYIKALTHGIKRLDSGFPLSLRLLREIHAILLKGGRGATKQPGEFRKSQNWIGGTNPSNALFVPPPVENLADCLSDLESFFHDESLPLLIKTGVAHVQFEAIHPFLDGNGRLGRLLVTLLLIQGGLIEDPVLYLSLYLKQNRATYYNLLQEVRTNGTWETWLEFFLEGVSITSEQAVKTTEEIHALFEEDQNKINTLGRVRFTCLKAFEYLKKMPQVSAPFLAKAIDKSTPAARNTLKHLEKLNIIEESSGKLRDKVYIYKRYLTILEQGTEPFGK